MRGAGKTTVAKMLAKILQRPYIEMDDRIAQKAKMGIADIVSEHGWDYFRDLESEVVGEIVQQDNAIISCGGGVVTRPNNVSLLKKNGKVFWLQANLKTLLDRIGTDPNRPSITGKAQKEDMTEILKQRKRLYQDASDVVINTQDYTPEQVAKYIIDEV